MTWLTIAKTIVVGVYELASELRRERRREREWAERPNLPKGCRRCGALNYLGGNVCSSCGWPL